MEWVKIKVICFIMCVLKSSAMTLNEIEDFKNFIEKTSHLDQILVKKGPTPDNDIPIDEDESISDYAWEESGKFEGDLILNDRQRKIIVEDVAEGLSRNGLNDITKRWPDNELVYYIQREHFNGDQVQAIQDGIDDLAQAACVKFRPYRKGDRDAVVIQGSRRGCFSNVGYQGGYQILNLNGRHPPGRGCFRHGTIVHELLHSLGFYHMQSSPDRDDYIDVLWENIHEPAKHNFRKYNTFSVSDFGVGYDYDSVLHYGRRAFSRNGQNTLVPKQSGASIGQRLRLSDKDVQKLNKMYCDAGNNDASNNNYASNNNDASSNNDATEESNQKPLKKKDNPKNKPFQGHGIGYHQGKTIVIKLPAAETIKLTNTPSFQLFDHFSKTPEAVPQTFIEGVRAGEELTYKYGPEAFYAQDDGARTYPYSNNKYKGTYNTELYETTINPISKDENLVSKKDVQILKSEKDELLHSPKSEVLKTNRDNDSSTDNLKDVTDVPIDEYSGKVSDVVNEAFERLGKIIKNHVYPSQIPDFEVYKTMLDHSEFSNLDKKIEPESKMVKEVALSTTDKGTDDNDDVDRNKKKVKLIENEDFSTEAAVTPHESYKSDHIPRGFDSSYGTALALNQMPKIKEEVYVTPEYATYEELHNKHDYSYLYKPNEESQKKRKHTLFGYLVPLHEKFIDSEDIKKDDQETYTYSPHNEYESVSSKLKQYDNDDHKTFSGIPSSKQGYSLFGVLVPLSQKWYKVDYDPLSGSYSIQKPESNEDYR